MTAIVIKIILVNICVPLVGETSQKEINLERTTRPGTATAARSAQGAKEKIVVTGCV